VAEAFLALGGNVGDVRTTLDRAQDMLVDSVDTRLIAASSHYRTPPWGKEDQPEFVNMCLLIETALSPRALLERMQAAERALGRDRTTEVRWGPRTIDIDLLAYDDLQLDEKELTLPHPRMFERAFVLVPLAEIAGERVIGGTRVRDALEKLDTSKIKLLPPHLTQLV